MRPGRDLSVLWALRSPCNLGCDYCYFGTLEDHRDVPPVAPGVLSHLPYGDLTLADITGFLSTAARSRIGRVFLAGGEPLIWPPIGEVMSMLVDAVIEVVVCTNGVPLNRPAIRSMLLDAGVHAVSVSLDSADAALNDLHRPARNRKDDWHAVVAGIRALVADRDVADNGPRVGMYSVVTRLNLAGLPDIARFAADLRLDYFVPQPISLDPDHPLHTELALRPDDLPALDDALDAIYHAGLGLQLPGPRYPAQVASTVRHDLQLVHGCFGGHQLAFIEPDGSVWECPSRHRIAATARRGAQRSITHRTASDLFPISPGTGPCDCPLYSGDCVNMWPLVQDFDRILTTGRTHP